MDTHLVYRLLFFVLTIVVLCGCEIKFPKMDIRASRRERLRINLSLIAIDWVLVRLTLGALPIALSAVVQEKGWGLLNLWSGSAFSKIAITVVFLDLTIYIQHVLFHATPLFWRFHKVHHSDLVLDFSTGVRFHPVEILLSLFIKSLAILAIGAEPLGVLIFEVALNTGSLFNHSNVCIPAHFDRFLRWIVITPDAHRIHHSTKMRETNSNFGFTVSIWDRVFGTLRNTPNGDDLFQVEIGLQTYKSNGHMGLVRLLRLPFLKEDQGYSFDKNEQPHV
ncbi:MAG: sterol desaturase family protein [Oligoflexales bacterium]